MPATDTSQKMKQAISHFKDELKNIRTGRANPDMLESVAVEVYGSKLKLRDLATITSPESRQLLVSPFSPDTTHPIAKGIELANLGLQATVEGSAIRILVPPMDETVRKEMVKLVKKYCENAKVSIRNIRRDENDSIKKDKAISEDDKKRLEKDVQNLTDKFCKEADAISSSKEKEILTI